MEDKETLRDMYPSNAKEKKISDESEKKSGEKKVEKVVTGSVKKRKKGFGKKIAENLIEDDSKSVCDYLFHDVLIPAIKATISDMVTGGIEMLLFGEKRRGSTSLRDRNKSFISYDRISTNNRDRGNTRDISKTARARHDFEEVVFETRGDAEDVLGHLVDLVADYEMVTVADFYDLVGVTSNFTDNKFGWTSMKNVIPVRARGGGYILDLPRPQLLE